MRAGDYTSYLRILGDKNNQVLNKVCWIITLVGPIILLGKIVGVFQSDNKSDCILILGITFFMAALHTWFIRKNVKSIVVTEVGLVNIEILLGIMWILKMNLNLTWFIVPIVSLMFCQIRVYVITCISNFLVMAVSFYFSIDYRSQRTITVLSKERWFADTLGGYAIEYLFMFIVGLFVCKQLAEQLEKIFSHTLQMKQKDIEVFTDKMTHLWKNDYMEKFFNELPETLKKGSAFVIFDMDNFKKVNDDYGHLEGDRALIRFSEVLKNIENSIPNCIASRFGGDEFTLFLPNIKSIGDLEKYLRMIKKLAEWSFEEDEILRIIKLSIGAAYIVNPEVGYEDVFTNADQCLLTVKKEGKNNFRCIEI